MRSRLSALALAVAVTLAPAARAADGDTSDRPGPDLRLVHLLDGLRPEAPDDDPARIAETKTAKDAARFGLDLAKPPHPLVAHAFANGRLWYVFYKATENAFGDRPYVIQRIRKTERNWRADGDGKPEEKVTYQVEVFKTIAGTLKRADQHFGDFGLQDAVRREIVKEYEIGFGEVPGVCEGTSWPFPADTLFRMLQPYATEAGLHDKVKFRASRKWSLTVALAKDGSYAIRSPELGIDLPKSPPDPALATPKPDAASKDVVLTPGAGPAGAKIGETTADDVRKLLGDPLETAAAGKGHTNLSFRRSLTCNFTPDGKLNTVITRPSFAGRTSNGLSHGMPRAKVMELLGAPPNQRADAVTWRYAGMVLTFDGFDRVARIVIFRG
jgi:hypothetical protein